ncbi:EF-hand domain-containing protein [bacterium]|nr:EF-hand domain-containing protein [bacterium]
MNGHRFGWAVVSLVLGTGAGSATAAPPGAGKPSAAGAERMFGTFDSDGDGKVILNDLPGPAAQRMKVADADGDGAVTRDELKRHFSSEPASGEKQPGSDVGKPKKPADEGRDFGKMFDKLDANADGKLEGDEIPAKMRDRLSRVDANGDGAIQREEMLSRMGKRPDRGPGGGRPSPAAMIEQLKLLDVDGDGKVALADLPEKAQKLAQKMDTDGDGSISTEEMQRGLPTGRPESGLARLDLTAGPEALFKNFDGNADGKLSKEELSVMPGPFLEKLDTNADGELTKEEIDPQWEKLRSRLEGMKGKRAQAPSEQVGARTLFLSQDADADGRVTKEEAKGTLAERFDELDGNKDGKLDEQEVEKGFVPSQTPPPPIKKKKAKGNAQA